MELEVCAPSGLSVGDGGLLSPYSRWWQSAWPPNPPCSPQVNCSGDASSTQLSGPCKGDFVGQPLEVHGSLS